jgi:hypothetical protein
LKFKRRNNHGSLTVKSGIYIFVFFHYRLIQKPGLIYLKSLLAIFVSYFIPYLYAVGETPPYNDIKIVRSDDNGIVITVELSEPGRYLTYAPEDSAYNLIIPILIGLPFNSKPFLSDVSGEAAESPKLPDGVKLISSGGRLAEVGRCRIVRGRKLCLINVYPYYINELYRKIELKIDFVHSDGAAKNLEYASYDPSFDSLFARSVLNYERFKEWPIGQKRATTAKPFLDIFSLSDEWFKIVTAGDGFVKITGADLQAAGLSLEGLESDSIHLFYGGGEPLPAQGSGERPILEEVAVRIFDGGDGFMGQSDYMIFFAEGADRWRYPPDSAPVFLENHYTNWNCYWLAAGGDFPEAGKRMTTFDGTPLEDDIPATNQGRFYVRTGQNRLLYRTNDQKIYDYYNWYWSDQEEDTFFVSVTCQPSVDSIGESFVHIRAGAAAINELEINRQPAVFTGGGINDFFYSTSNLKYGLNRFQTSMRGYYDAPPFLDFCEVSYVGYLSPYNDVLDFTLNGYYGRAELIVDNGFTQTSMMFDLSHSKDPVIIENAVTTAQEITFQHDAPSSSGRRFYMTTLGRMATPVQIKKTTLPGLDEIVRRTDLFIISPEEFIPYLEDYKSYREAVSDISISLFSVEDIMNRFSFGLYDPGAIRDFLKYAYENCPEPSPSAVLLVGDGSYDYENNLKLAVDENFVPPYIHQLDFSASDDNYVYFGDYGWLDSDGSYCDTCEDRGYDMMIARWPIRSVAELNNIVDKVKTYESSTNFGSWRTTVTLVADDEYAMGKYETLIHGRQTERLQLYHLPPSFKRNKIYLWEYPLDSERNKPGVNDAIVRSINDGTLLINYVGHGNPDTWAHEHVFNRGVDLQRLHNRDRLTLVFTASCSIALYDNPLRPGMAEELIRMPDGAVGTIAATRLVYAAENHDYNTLFFDFLFGPGNLTVNQAVFAAKLLRQYNTSYPEQRINDRKYAYFGDPYLKLGIPRDSIVFTEYPEVLTALDRHAVKGEVVDGRTGAHVDFDGTAEVFVYDSDILRMYRSVNDNGVPADSLSYALNGPILYRGTTPIEDGDFEFSFVTPLDIGYGGKGAKISAYGSSSSADAYNMVDSILVSADIISSADSVGPEIKYGFEGRNGFVSGDKISAKEILIVQILDSSGINLTGGTGHGITLTIDNNVEDIVNLTGLFQYDPGSFTEGEIRYDIGRLPQGLHTFKIKAWDNANNSALTEFSAEVVEEGEFALYELMNYPNPMKERTTFSFVLTSPARKVDLELFTLSGRRIMAVERFSAPAGYNEFYCWDGRDLDGDRVATGVYIYKATAFSAQGNKVIESFSKVVVIN